MVWFYRLFTKVLIRTKIKDSSTALCTYSDMANHCSCSCEVEEDKCCCYVKTEQGKAADKAEGKL